MSGVQTIEKTQCFRHKNGPARFQTACGGKKKEGKVSEQKRGVSGEKKRKIPGGKIEGARRGLSKEKGRSINEAHRRVTSQKERRGGAVQKTQKGRHLARTN